MPWFYQRPNLLVRYGEGGATPPSFTITESGGTIASGEEFTLIVAGGGLTDTTSVVIDGIESTNINVISDTQLKAIAGFVLPGVNLEMVAK